MTTKEENERLAQLLAERLGLGPIQRPATMHLPNAEWQEADRLGRLLLENLDAQDARRSELSIENPKENQ